MRFDLADPPLNVEPVGSGLAASYTRDAGIAGHSSVIFSHRYQDGSIRRDFILQSQDNTIGSIDWGARAPFDPALWGGTANTSRLPHVGLGKWIGGIGNFPGQGDSDPYLTVVPSTYTGDGFVPLAPGLGAMRVSMPKGTTLANGTGSPIVDGSSVFGSQPYVDARMFMPEPKFGVLSEAWLRYYVFIDASYNPTLADKKNFYEDGTTPRWIDMGGKWLIGFSHWSAYGGNNNYGGGGHGWSMRPEFADNMTDMDSKAPQYRSVGTGLSIVDLQSGYNPAGAPTANPGPYGQPPAHASYAGTLTTNQREMGQRGGLMARLYPGRWYCIEEHIKLNSVATANVAEGDGRLWQADGQIEWYLDGRLAMTKGGLVFRALPANPGDGTLRNPAREIGIADIWMNFYHGGVTPNTYIRNYFVSGLVVAEQRVGPMNLDPTWRQGMTTLTWKQFGNAGITVDPKNNAALNPNGAGNLAPWHINTGGTFTNFSDANGAWESYGGGVWDERYGRFRVWNGGHNDYAGNEIYAFDAYLDSPAFFLERPPTGCIGNTGLLDDNQETTNRYFDGRPRSTHSYDLLCAVAGDFYYAAPGAPYKAGSIGAVPALFKFTRSTADWTLIPGTTGVFPINGGTSAGQGSLIYDSKRNRLYAWPSANTQASYWDITAGATTSTGVITGASTSGTNHAIYIPELDLQVVLAPDYVKHLGVYDYDRTTAGTLHHPGASGTAPASPSYSLPFFYMNGVWVAGWGGGVGAIMCWHGGASVYVLTPPATGNPATTAWAWSVLSAAGANTVIPPAPNSNGVFGRLQYSAKLGGLLLSARATTAPYFFALR